ncbi:MAG: GNAT family N-acetyltransferase [Verrucomicrobiota bacterium]|nr:GNAT family N-acetyltransferase [Verrucomicrobiota bacterium]
MIPVLSPALIDEQPVVESLLQACLQELSHYAPIPKDSSGRYIYRWVEYYWTSPKRHPYLMRLDGTVIGFVFVREREADEDGAWQYEIAEFYLCPAYRNKGWGLAMACQLLASHQGHWQISYDKDNLTAQAFWTKVVHSFDPACIPIPEDDNRARYELVV